MKISKLTLISIAFLLGFSPLTSALSIVAKEEAPYIGNELPGRGLSIEIVNTAFERAGYKTKVVFETWPRTYEGALIGIHDVIGSIWQNREREKDFVFSDPYLFHEIKFIKRKADTAISFNNIDDLQGLIIGTLKNYAYRDDFTQSRQFMKLQQNHLIQNLLFLTQGHIDMTLGDIRKIRYEMNKFMKSSMKNLEILPKALIKRGVHIAVSKSNPHHAEIISKFNKALESMKSDGTYNAILKKHDKPSLL
ncbi:MAG: transporter substrate-binding domain-containing protein [Methylococcales bacterium]|nr:transporter substrate-binding domain-containing protein [Methylococcales bacterium]